MEKDWDFPNILFQERQSKGLEYLYAVIPAFAGMTGERPLVLKYTLKARGKRRKSEFVVNLAIDLSIDGYLRTTVARSV